MNELVKSLISPLLESDTKNIALIPGGYKPATSGHFYLVNEISKRPEIDEVLVIIGHKTRDGITKEDSLKIWEIYKKYLSPKVHIKIADNTSPILDIHKIIANNPQNFYYPVVGSRGSQDDGDLKRFDSLKLKYDNFKVIVVNGDPEISGTKARQSILNNSFEQFQKYLPVELSIQERKEIWDIVKIDHILNENDISKDINPKIQSHIDGLIDFYIDKGLNIQPLPKLKFIHDDEKNAEDFFGKTGYYDPNEKLIVIYTCNRHPKDFMKSFAHELFHHHQNLEGKLTNISGTNTSEDDHLNEIERETYEQSQLLFRNWTDSLK